MARSLTSTLDKLAASGKLDGFAKNGRSDAGNVISLDLSRIDADPAQPRRTFDEGKLTALSESIAAQGVLQPITVQPQNADGKHLIIMGERRWRAAKLAGLSTIPAVVRDATADLRAIQLTENVQRADLTTMEIAQAVEQMRRDGKKRSEIAKALGWSDAEVSRFAGILKMPDELRDLAQGNVPARALADLHALWKKNESAVQGFLSVTPAEDISRVTVAALRSEIEAGQGASATGFDQRDQPVSGPSSRTRPSNNMARETEPSAAGFASGPVAILCRHGGAVGRILTDRKASSNKALMVSLDDGARVKEVPLSEIELLEVVDA